MPNFFLAFTAVTTMAFLASTTTAVVAMPFLNANNNNQQQIWKRANLTYEAPIPCADPSASFLYLVAPDCYPGQMPIQEPFTAANYSIAAIEPQTGLISWCGPAHAKPPVRAMGQETGCIYELKDGFEAEDATVTCLDRNTGKKRFVVSLGDLASNASGVTPNNDTKFQSFSPAQVQEVDTNRAYIAFDRKDSRNPYGGEGLAWFAFDPSQSVFTHSKFTFPCSMNQPYTCAGPGHPFFAKASEGASVKYAAAGANNADYNCNCCSYGWDASDGNNTVDIYRHLAPLWTRKEPVYQDFCGGGVVPLNVDGCVLGGSGNTYVSDVFCYNLDDGSIRWQHHSSAYGMSGYRLLTNQKGEKRLFAYLTFYDFIENEQVFQMGVFKVPGYNSSTPSSAKLKRLQHQVVKDDKATPAPPPKNWNPPLWISKGQYNYVHGTWRSAGGCIATDGQRIFSSTMPTGAGRKSNSTRANHVTIVAHDIETGNVTDIQQADGSDAPFDMNGRIAVGVYYFTSSHGNSTTTSSSISNSSSSWIVMATGDEFSKRISPKYHRYKHWDYLRMVGFPVL